MLPDRPLSANSMALIHVRLGGRPGLPEPSMGAHGTLLVLSCHGSFVLSFSFYSLRYVFPFLRIGRRYLAYICFCPLLKAGRRLVLSVFLPTI